MKLNFDGKEAKLIEKVIKTEQEFFIIALFARKDKEAPKQSNYIVYEIEVNEIKWLTTDTQTHALILFSLIAYFLKKDINILRKGGKK